MHKRRQSPRCLPKQADGGSKSVAPPSSDRRAVKWLLAVVTAGVAFVAGGGTVWLRLGGDDTLGEFPSEYLGLQVPALYQEEVDQALQRAHTSLRIHNEWNFTGVSTPEEAKLYLTGNHLLFKHISAFVEAGLGAIELPHEDLGQSYVACAAGGPIVFDWFLGDVNVSQSVNKGFSRLTRRFGYSTILHSIPDEDVMARCGRVLAMQAPASDMLLPYADTFELHMEIAETWVSNSRKSTLSAGKMVSILPYSQWDLDAVTVTSKVHAPRSVQHWLNQHGDEEMAAVMGESHWEELKAQKPTSERLVGEVQATCRFSSGVEALRCLHPATMAVAQPSTVTSDIFLEWSTMNWVDEEGGSEATSDVNVESFVWSNSKEE